MATNTPKDNSEKPARSASHALAPRSSVTATAPASDPQQLSQEAYDGALLDPRTLSTYTSGTPPMIVLNDDELARVRRVLGATRPSANSSAPAPQSTLWPPRGLPSGLYRDVLTSRYRSQYAYYFVATLYNTCIILQIVLGAALTALGSVSQKHGLAIVLIAAFNTVNAGLLALMYNSGLPDRIRHDRNTFADVELRLVEILNTGVLQFNLPDKGGDVVTNVVSFAFSMYTTAIRTVQDNKPSSYVTSTSGKHTTALAY